MKTDKEKLIQQLQQLHAYHIIHYEPPKDSPQLYFHRDRPSTADLTSTPNACRKERRATKSAYKQYGCMYRTNLLAAVNPLLRISETTPPGIVTSATIACKKITTAHREGIFEYTYPYHPGFAATLRQQELLKQLGGIKKKKPGR